MRPVYEADFRLTEDVGHAPNLLSGIREQRVSHRRLEQVEEACSLRHDTAQCIRRVSDGFYTCL